METGEKAKTFKEMKLWRLKTKKKKKKKEEEEGGKHVICRRLLNNSASELGSTGMKTRRTEVVNEI